MSTQATGSIRLNIVDGARQPINDDLQTLLRILDGSKKQVATKWVKGSVVPILGLPYHDNFDDWYTIIIHADGYEDTGIYPVRLMAGRLIDAYVMLIPNDGHFRFRPIEDIRGDLKLYPLDLLPAIRTKLSMISAKERGIGYVENQAHRGADDRGVEATGSGT